MYLKILKMFLEILKMFRDTLKVFRKLLKIIMSTLAPSLTRTYSMHLKLTLEIFFGKRRRLMTQSFGHVNHS